MEPFQPNTGPMSPILRALALGLLVETVVPLLNAPREANGPSLGHDVPSAEGGADVFQSLRSKCGELSSLVLRADDPGEAAAYVLGYLPKHLDYVFELVHGQKRRPEFRDLEADIRFAHRNGRHNGDGA